ncbi:Abi-like protein [Haloechinothrix alba]|uniref:Abi-like protein n=1 Tax=Haloechinothrix alba TaxID=664784 RepID=A0A238XTM8_9PSEU|nr:Abi family protein [Haloechinothrix alba]SNR61918.1 Abi-like protein [Haloechinothrix alba]
MSRSLRPRGSLSYDKPALSLDGLVDRLAERGLEVPDPDRARRYLRHIGYYRLAPYTIPFQQGRPDHFFRAGAAFDDVLDLYVFDRTLRLLVMDALERVEIAARAALTDHMSTTYGDPHWYIDASHFRDHGKHVRLLRIVRDTCDEQLRGSRAAVERRPRRLPGNPDHACDLMAEGNGRPAGAVEEASLPGPGVAAVRARLGVATQRLGTTAP